MLGRRIVAAAVFGWGAISSGFAEVTPLQAALDLARTTAWSRESALEVVRALMVDGDFSTEDRAILEALTNPQAAFAKVDSRFVPVPRPGTPPYEAMRMALEPFDPKDLYEGGTAGLVRLVEVASLGPQPRIVVERFLGARFLAAANGSSLTNYYEPLQAEADYLALTLGAAPEAIRKQGLDMAKKIAAAIVAERKLTPFPATLWGLDSSQPPRLPRPGQSPPKAPRAPPAAPPTALALDPMLFLRVKLPTGKLRDLPMPSLCIGLAVKEAVAKWLGTSAGSLSLRFLGKEVGDQTELRSLGVVDASILEVETR